VSSCFIFNLYDRAIIPINELIHNPFLYPIHPIPTADRVSNLNSLNGLVVIITHEYLCPWDMAMVSLVHNDDREIVGVELLESLAARPSDGGHGRDHDVAHGRGLPVRLLDLHPQVGVRLEDLVPCLVEQLLAVRYDQHLLLEDLWEVREDNGFARACSEGDELPAHPRVIVLDNGIESFLLVIA
jgi:hypothetical protein